MFQFIHAADLHLDSPLRGLESYEGAPVEEIRSATRRAFDNLVKTAIERQVAMVLLAGDLYDGDWQDYNTGLYFVKRMKELEKAGISVCMISGNHDAESRITKDLRLPGNVTRFDTSRPESRRFDELRCVVHGQGFATRAVTDDLSAAYPDALAGYFNIGLLHTCLDGKPGHEPYAPCSVDGLRTKGYDYWALGHVHKREVVSEDPWVVFSGNIQGRHIREEGPKGCTLVTVADDGSSALEEIHLDVLRWQRCELDISGIDVLDAIYQRFDEELEKRVRSAGGRSLALRLVLCGETGLHGQLHRNHEHVYAELRSCANSAGSSGVWLQKSELATRPLPDSETLATRDAALEDLLVYIDSLRIDTETQSLMHAEIDSLLKKLPREATKEDIPDLENLQQRLALLDDVAELLNGKLASSGDT